MISPMLKREDGFTLLEVVFASAILAIGMLGYSKIKTASRYSRVFSKQLSQSIQLSNNQMEDFLLNGYNSSMLSATAGTAHLHGDFDVDLQVGAFELDSASWTVRENCPSELTKLLKFTSEWGNSKQLQLTQVQVRP